MGLMLFTGVFAALRTGDPGRGCLWLLCGELSAGSDGGQLWASSQGTGTWARWQWSRGRGVWGDTGGGRAGLAAGLGVVEEEVEV